MEKKLQKNATRKQVFILMGIFVLLLALAGCGSSKETAEDLSEEVAAFYNSIEKTQSTTSDNSNIVIGSVNMGMNGEWFSEVMNGIKDAGKNLGVTVKMLDSNSDLKLEAQNINSLMNEKIDALIISPISSDETAAALQKVKIANIPIVTWNTTVNTDVTTAVGVDSNALGADTGDYVVEYIKTYNLKKVNMILITNTTYDIGIARCDGFKSAIKDLIDEGIINIIAEDEAETFEAGVSVTEKLLKKYPETDMIWAWNQGALLGCIDVVKTMGNKNIVVMGTDMSMALANDMLDNEVNLQAVTTQLPYNMGYKAVVSAVNAVKGENVDKKVIIPLSTYTKEQTAEIEQYIETHKNLVTE